MKNKRGPKCVLEVGGFTCGWEALRPGGWGPIPYGRGPPRLGEGSEQPIKRSPQREVWPKFREALSREWPRTMMSLGRAWPRIRRRSGFVILILYF